jgi:hypothetical protein
MRHFSERERKELVVAARKLKRETGKSIGDYLMAIICGENKAFAIQAIKIYLDSTLVKESQQEINITKQETGPGIYLPEEQSDPATQNGVAPTQRSSDRILQ